MDTSSPIIDTIWFNEGFGRYAAIAAIAAGMSDPDGAAYRERHLAALRAVLDGAPRFIQRLPLAVLSREASFMYSEDFRIGRNVFARGALMAAEMDDRIRAESGGARSLRDALRFLVARTSRSQTAFEADTFPDLVESGTGVKVRDIYERWARAPTSS